MANIRIKQALVDNICSDIAQAAAAVAAHARKSMGNTSHKTVVKKVRKGLGFSY